MRTSLPSGLTLFAVSLLISGCATTYDPETICTTEWIGQRAEIAIDRIERRTKSSMKTLTRAADGWTQGRTPGPFQMLAIGSALRSLEDEIKNGRGMKDLRILANTCDDPKIISESLTGFMRDQDVPDNLIDFIERTETYQNLIAPDTKPSDINPINNT